LIDQWDENVRPASELETDIQRGKIQGLLWFGPAPATPIFNEYARGMRLFAQFIVRAGDAHAAAKWLLPLDLSTEKEGTYTNHFGRVQILRKVRRVIDKGAAPLDLIRALSMELGRSLPAEAARLYEEARGEIPGYPKNLSDIPDAARTYPFYERALWR
jgi:NADH dehydrogenase/NADH:ubiquinone oxidoreductase subunit G